MLIDRFDLKMAFFFICIHTQWSIYLSIKIKFNLFVCAHKNSFYTSTKELDASGKYCYSFCCCCHLYLVAYGFFFLLFFRNMWTHIITAPMSSCLNWFNCLKFNGCRWPLQNSIHRVWVCIYFYIVKSGWTRSINCVCGVCVSKNFTDTGTTIIGNLWTTRTHCHKIKRMQTKWLPPPPPRLLLMPKLKLYVFVLRTLHLSTVQFKPIASHSLSTLNSWNLFLFFFFNFFILLWLSATMPVHVFLSSFSFNFNLKVEEKKSP